MNGSSFTPHGESAVIFDALSSPSTSGGCLILLTAMSTSQVVHAHPTFDTLLFLAWRQAMTHWAMSPGCGPKVLSPLVLHLLRLSFHASNCKVSLVSHFPCPLHAPLTHRPHPTKPSACPQDGHYPPTHPPGSCGLAAAGREDRRPVARRRSSKKQHPQYYPHASHAL